MIVGILFSGIGTGLVVLVTALALEAGLTTAALGYVGGGWVGTALFIHLALRKAGSSAL